MSPESNLDSALQIFFFFIEYLIIEAPESRTGGALEKALYCPSGNVTRQISKTENWRIKDTGS